MSKKILSVFLAAIMIVCAIPAIALVSFADGGTEYRTDKSFSGYEDLWYNDNLMSFVDLTGITEDNSIEFTDANDADLKALIAANEADYKLVYTSAGIEPTGNAGGIYNGHHSYIKIVGGANKGKYYQIYNRGAAYTINDKGELLFTESDTYVGVLIAHAFSEDDTLNLSAGPTKWTLSQNHHQINNGVTVDDYLLDSTNQMTVEFTSKDNGTVSSGTSRFLTVTGNTFFFYQTGGIHNRVTKTTFTMPQYGSLHTAYVGYMSGTASSTSDAKTYASYYMYSVDGINTVNAAATSAYSTNGGILATRAGATGFQHYFIRTYKSQLTAAQMAQNHFADLCYYYKLDVPTSFKSTPFNEKEWSSFYGLFSKYGVGNCDEAAVLEMQAILDAPTDYIPLSFEYYKNLWYNDGHLMSFVDMTNIEADDVYSGTLTDTGDYRVILTTGQESTKPFDNAGTRAYVRISAGANEGKYYIVYSRGGSISVSGGILTTTPYSDAQGAGVILSHAYSDNDENWTPSSSLYLNAYEYDSYLTSEFTTETVARKGSQTGTQRILWAGAQTTFYYDGTKLNDRKATHTIALSEGDFLQTAVIGSITDSGTDDATSTYNKSSYIVKDGDSFVTKTSTAVENGHSTMGAYTFSANNYAFQQYYIRTYDVALTADQLAQNHFADLCYYYKLNASGLNADSLNATFYNLFNGYELGKADKAELQAIIDSANYSNIVKFVGFQARTNKNIGLRSIYAINTDVAKYYDITGYGALTAYYKDGTAFKDYTVTYEGGEVTSENSAAVWGTIGDGATLKTISAAEQEMYTDYSTDKYVLFAYTTNYVALKDGETYYDKDNYGDLINMFKADGSLVDGAELQTAQLEAKMIYRAFVIDANGDITYVNAESANHSDANGAVSMKGISEWYYANYEDLRVQAPIAYIHSLFAEA
ncbi:MAG: hypothetical protein IKA74_04720 [Clostridia bacterium]|nr:hypothetical protein [Clostridia bacterium]